MQRSKRHWLCGCYRFTEVSHWTKERSTLIIFFVFWQPRVLFINCFRVRMIVPTSIGYNWIAKKIGGINQRA